MCNIKREAAYGYNLVLYAEQRISLKKKKNLTALHIQAHIFLTSLLKFDPRFYCSHKQTVERKQMLRKLQLKIVTEDSQFLVCTVPLSLYTQHNPPLQNSSN